MHHCTCRFWLIAMAALTSLYAINDNSACHKKKTHFQLIYLVSFSAIFWFFPPSPVSFSFVLLCDVVNVVAQLCTGVAQWYYQRMTNLHFCVLFKNWLFSEKGFFIRLRDEFMQFNGMCQWVLENLSKWFCVVFRRN